jgi:hypothetical protein
VPLRVPFPSAARRFVLCLLPPAMGLGCGHATPEDCARMTDHYVDLAAAETPGAATMSAAQVAAVREVERGLKRAEPTYRRVQDRCDSVTRSEARCALRASTTAEWEACVRTPAADAR